MTQVRDVVNTNPAVEPERKSTGMIRWGLCAAAAFAGVLGLGQKLNKPAVEALERPASTASVTTVAAGQNTYTVMPDGKAVLSARKPAKAEPQ